MSEAGFPARGLSTGRFPFLVAASFSPGKGMGQGLVAASYCFSLQRPLADHTHFSLAGWGSLTMYSWLFFPRWDLLTKQPVAECYC